MPVPVAFGIFRAAELGGSLYQRKIGLVIGTRPEAIKLAPVAAALSAQGLPVRLYLTGQHPGLDLADHGLGDFPVTPLHQPGLPDPVEHADRVAHALGHVWKMDRPALALVQGDTSSAAGGARAAKAAGVALGHVEAGLRTHDRALPWPEEDFRVEIDAQSDLLFAPTPVSAANLMIEHCPGRVHITGNTGIDALLLALGSDAQSLARLRRRSRALNLLVTCHRRESWGAGFERVATALAALASDAGTAIDVVLHPNPVVSDAMFRLLGGEPSIRLLPPLSHRAMLDAMLRSDIILSDSGGVQEEAPALGIPLLVLRDKTERPEGIEAGAMQLVGTDTDRIVAAVRDLAAQAGRGAHPPVFPYGDGHAAPRIAHAVAGWLAEQEYPAEQPLRA